MNTKTLLGVSLTAVFAISMVGFAYALSDYFDITSATATDTEDGFQGTAATVDKIPRNPQGISELDGTYLIVGFGWANTLNGEGFLAAIHPDFKDSTQNPKSWHTHPVTLTPNNSTGHPLPANTFCIADLRSSQGGLALNNDGILVNVDTTNPENDAVGITAADVNAVVSFKAKVDLQCPVFTVDNQNNPFGPAAVLVEVLDGVPPS